MTSPLAATVQTRIGTSRSRRTAVVSTVTATEVKVRFADTEVVVDGFLNSYYPVVDDTVILLREESSWLLLGRVAGSITDTGAPAWIPFTMLNGWVGHDPTNWFTPSYVLLADGVVRFRGLVNGAAKTSDVFANLPAAFRPVKSAMFVTVGDSLFAAIRVDPGGDVSRYLGTAGFMSLDSISFSVAPQ